MRDRTSIILILLTAFLFAKSPFYAVQTHLGQYRRADMDSLAVELQLDLIQEAGIEMIRDECLWSDVEVDSGIYVIPPEVDHYVRSALTRNIDIYLILNYNNSIYAPSNGSGVTTQANREAYARYCQAVVGYFSPLGVKHYEIWNEPNHGVLFWTPQPNANDYTTLLQTAYDSIKAIDTSVTVIGCATSPAIGNPSPYIEGLDFIRDVYAAGGGNYMDAVSFHLYQIAYRPENELRSYVSDIKSYVGDKPIYFSEFGYPTHHAWPNISLQKQAQYITRMFLICQTDPQIQSAVYYDLKNDGNVIEEPEHNFGLLEFDRTPKLSYLALKNLIRKTNAETPESYISINDAYISRFTDSLFVAWAYSGSKSTKYYTNSQFTRVENMYGDTISYLINSTDTITLQISENPVFYIDQVQSPLLQSFDLEADELLLYVDENVNLNFNANDINGIPVIPDPNSISWTYTGDYGTFDNSTFSASSPEDGMIIGEIQGLRDTIKVKVLEKGSFYVLENFSDTSSFTLTSSYLNMDNSYFSSTNGETLELNYEYSGSGAIAYINKNILINHLADSIYLDIRTDEKEYDFRLYCKDAKGASYTLYMQPRPTDWTNCWGTESCEINIPEAASAPVNIYKIYIKLRPGSTTQTEPYSGKIELDGLRLERRYPVNIADDHAIPDRIHLSQNYPNPFNGNTRIYFRLPYDSHVRIDIFDLKGAIVNAVIDEQYSAGEHYLDLNMQDLPSGVYIYRLCSNNMAINKKFVYMK